MAEGYRQALKDDESLAMFLGVLKDFDSDFCRVMNEGRDFTLKLEVHGNAGKLLHCRVNNDNFSRPANAQRPAGRVNPPVA